MELGQKLLDALLVYCKIDVEKKIKELNKLPDSTEPIVVRETPKIKLAEIENELATNKKLIEMTSGGEDGEGESGSDSEPSEDNLEEEELAQIVPLPKKKEEPEPPKQATKKKVAEPIKVDKEEKAASAQNKARPVIKQQLPVQSKSPMKRIM